MTEEPLETFPKEFAGPLVERVVNREESALLDRAIEHLIEVWGEGKTCPYCEHDTWQIGPVVEFSTLYGGGDLVAIPVSCEKCHQTTFINAIEAGLVDNANE